MTTKHDAAFDGYDLPAVPLTAEDDEMLFAISYAQGYKQYPDPEVQKQYEAWQERNGKK